MYVENVFGAVFDSVGRDVTISVGMDTSSYRYVDGSRQKK